MTSLIDYSSIPLDPVLKWQHNQQANRLDADCIITAAGLSTRMGQWKMMLPYLYGTILDASIKNALSACRRVIVVSGSRGEVLQQRYRGLSRISLVHHAAYRLGLFSSIQCAVKAVNTDYFFITHGDMPCIPSSIFHRLWAGRGAYSLFPAYQNIPGHPVLLPAASMALIGASAPHRRMRQLLLAGEVRYLTVNTAAIHQDVDTYSAYQTLCLNG